MIPTDLLKMEYKKSTKGIALAKRLENINAFAGLSRQELEFGSKERLLYLYKSKLGEQVCIQYPGKETISGNQERVRPWDFRPKLISVTGEVMKDLSFPNIWDDLAAMHISNNEVLSILAALLFRMAFMEGHVSQKLLADYQDIDIKSMRTIVTGAIPFEWHAPKYPLEIMDYLDARIGKIRGASIEAYLVYNDLLVQNEDCKYYYRDVLLRKGKWNSSIGRNNTLLSHISVIEYLQGRITFSEIMSRFQRGMGVAPVSLNRIPGITNNIIEI